jgi:catechol-2,3-dioxygenase
MASLSFDHLAIPVADAAHARELFGQIALCALADGRSLPKPATDLPHYAFSVRDRATLERWRQRLKSAGFDPRDEVHGNQVSVYFEDRTGTTWEITAPPSRNRPDREAGAVISDWLAKHSNPGRNGPDTSATGPNR